MEKMPERLFLSFIYPLSCVIRSPSQPTSSSNGVLLLGTRREQLTHVRYTSAPASLWFWPTLVVDTCTKLLLSQRPHVTFTDLYNHNKRLVGRTPKVTAPLLHKFATNPHFPRAERGILIFDCINSIVFLKEG